jgi:hypothetical protein
MLRVISALFLLLLTSGCAYRGYEVQAPDPVEEFPDLNIAEVYDPCGDGPGVDEVLLILGDGTILAWYLDLGLAILEPGNYITTDSQGCSFEVTESMEVVEL